MKKKIGTSKSLKKYEQAGQVDGPGKGKGTDRTAAQKQYTSDSLSIAKNWNTIKTSKNPKELDKAENTLNKINEKSPKGRVSSMGPAGKEFDNFLTNSDIYKPENRKKGGQIGKYKKGGSVGKTPKTPAQKKFAALAPPKNKITFADKIAGAKKKK